MRAIFVASAALLALSATAAYAGEGNGDPFPGPNAAVTTKADPTGIASRDDAPFNYYNKGTPVDTSHVQLSYDHADDPYGYHVAGTAVKQAAPTVGPEDTTATAAAQNTERGKTTLTQHTGTAIPGSPSSPHG